MNAMAKDAWTAGELFDADALDQPKELVRPVDLLAAKRAGL